MHIYDMRHLRYSLLFLSVFFVQSGCVNVSLPVAEDSMRLQVSRQQLKERSHEQNLGATAEALEKRFYKNFLLSEKYPLPLRVVIKGYAKMGHIEFASYYLSFVSYKYGVLKDQKLADEAAALLDAIAAMDAANGLDGYIPRIVALDDAKGLQVIHNDNHANAYSQLIMAYALAYTLIDDKNVKQKVQEHVRRMARWWLACDFILRDEKGNLVPHSNLKFANSASRQLDALMIAEAAVRILPDSRLRKKMAAALADFVEKGYRKTKAQWGIDTKLVRLPSFSSHWLNGLRLYTLNILSRHKNYELMMDAYYQHVARHRNPHVWLMANAVSPEFTKKPFPEDIISTYPLNPNDHEVINRYDVDGKKILPMSKGEKHAESHKPLPVHKRPLSPFEWKRNPYRLDGNIGKSGLTEYNGLDFLLVYWMAKYYRVL